MKFFKWLRTVPSMVFVGAILFLVLSIGGGLLLWANNFAGNMVHDQLAAQRIFFPAKGSPGFDAKTYPGLQRYAGKQLTTGPEAKAWANQYIAVHLKETAGGKTYSEVSNLSRANPNDANLAAQVQTLFRGETLRGLLLYAWAWSVVGMIALYVGIAAEVGAFALLLALAGGYLFHLRDVRRGHASTSEAVEPKVLTPTV